MMVHLIVFVLFACAFETSDADMLENFQNLEDFVFSVKTVPELEAAGKTKVTTQDEVLIVDHMKGSNGASWMRARGIQYAEHPIGPLRWQPPLPKQADLNHETDATDWGDDCVQGPFLARISSIQEHSMSESCLYLNVWAPYDTTPKKKHLVPVLFWFHGGSFTAGGSTSYNADHILAHRQDVVVVTVNYRLGALGFLGGNAIAKNTTDGSAGNFGLQDTRLAMKWVQRNIASFGGDPHRVTIFGESAGASLVETHLSAPRSNGLFRSAILQSGAFDNYTIQPNPEEIFALFASRAGCNPEATSVMQCLRAVPLWAPGQHETQGLMPAISGINYGYGFGPTIDFVELSESPLDSAKAGRLNKLTSAIIGTTHDEGHLLMPMMMPLGNGPRSTDADFQQWLQDYYPEANAAIDKQYNDYHTMSNFSIWETASLIYTDSQYLCPTQESAQWLSNIGATIFVYRLEYKPSLFDEISRIVYQEAWCSDYSRCEEINLVDPGVGHGADVYLLFNQPNLNATDNIVGRTIIDYWINFATSGNPSDGDGQVPSWPTFLPGNITMAIDTKPVPIANLRQSYCDFWSHTPSGLPPEENRLPIIV